MRTKDLGSFGGTIKYSELSDLGKGGMKGSCKKKGRFSIVECVETLVETRPCRESRACFHQGRLMRIFIFFSFWGGISYGDVGSSRELDIWWCRLACCLL